MLFKNGTAVPPRWLAPAFVVATFLPFLEAWQVLQARSITAVSCSGLFSGAGCFIGEFIGKLLFGESTRYLGFVMFNACLGVLILYLGYMLHQRRRQLIAGEA
jgi:hypothetical protein